MLVISGKIMQQLLNESNCVLCLQILNKEVAIGKLKLVATHGHRQRKLFKVAWESQEQIFYCKNLITIQSPEI